MADNGRMPAVLLRIQGLRADLSRAEQQVVDYVLECPEQVIYLSVAGLAERSHVSDATVVRTCRSLGYNGYQDFKITLAQDLVSPLQNIHEEIARDDSAEVIVDKVFQSTMHTITFTHDTLRVADLEATAKKLMAARRVMIFGLGNSHAMALDFQHKLMRLGVDAAAYCDSHMQAIAASYAGSEDVVFAISHSGSSRDIVESVQLAKQRGATAISLTSLGASPLSKASDINLFTASRETRFRIVALNSRIAQMVIFDSIYTIMASRMPGAVEGFHAVEKALNTKKY